MKKIKIKGMLLLTLVAISTVVLLYCCSSFDTDLNEEDYVARETVKSDETKIVVTESGAAIYIPREAVPPTEDGEIGSMVFSIEKDTETDFPALPSGEVLVSDLYKFGPSGFIFANPVRVTIPITGDIEGKEILLYRINPTTGEAESYPAIIDYENKTASAFTYEFSPWGATMRERTSTAYGYLKIHNKMGTACQVCVESVTLKYPENETNFDASMAKIYVGTAGTTGLEDDMGWFLPQGDYRVCISWHNGYYYNPGTRVFRTYREFSLNKAAISATGTFWPEVDINVSGNGEEADCDCKPQYTSSVGTGDVQVTLTWFSNDAIDLDLYVIDPTEEVCYYGNEVTSTGGRLDRDNYCSEYINGRPENIFWKNAGVGTYNVKVNWYSDCSTGKSSQEYSLRIITPGEVKTYNGTIGADQTIDAATFDVNQVASSTFTEVNRISTSRANMPAK